MNNMGNLFKSLFKSNKKNKKMGTNEKSISDYERDYSYMDFEWIKGEYLSVVEKYKGVSTNGDFTFIDFLSGRKINVDVLDEYMITYPSDTSSNILNQSTTHIVNDNPKESTVTSIIYEEEERNTDSPIYKLLKKQKKNMVDVSIKIKLNLPPKELYNVLLGSFEDAEKEIIDFVLDGIDINNIKKSLADSVKKSYYSESSKNKKETRESEEMENENR
jgi:hypothetical protein